MRKFYDVRVGVCDMCPDDSWDVAHHEFAHLFAEDNRLWRERPDLRAQYILRGEELQKRFTKRCFHFMADCGGDEISLCAECLKKLTREVEG